MESGSDAALVEGEEGYVDVRNANEADLKDVRTRLRVLSVTVFECYRIYVSADGQRRWK